ncbi:hypothetical protein M427DRAFT_138368 [Gonapodya prolifera JEL478]|uniref:Conserved oligomeric Golgi complex subunit 5 n=1 Tax=Gonapodya prolifera (strain JEL478) TaxID=1344416 RepID=A0A139A3D5_GONPJ|nr:hypothetical protein M427DRAFT_138368 [Gonapodya prolifera JEL478]|eukprot:KXS11280.1 hypothetical protein M427DRAFT_138368 [Gonapodya prolifera JEL478]
MSLRERLIHHTGPATTGAIASIIHEFGLPSFDPERHASELLATHSPSHRTASPVHSEKVSTDPMIGLLNSSGRYENGFERTGKDDKSIAWTIDDSRREESDLMDLESLQQAAFPDIAPLIAKLEVQLDVLSRSIHEQVTMRHSELIQQVTGLADLSEQLKTLKEAVLELQGSVDRIKAKTTAPYNALSSLTTQLSRALVAADYLRKISRFLSLQKRLTLQMKSAAEAPPTNMTETSPGAIGPSSTRIINSREVELGAAALTLSEIDALCLQSDLSGISVVEKELEFISQSRKDIINHADTIMNGVLGLSAKVTVLDQTPASISEALQAPTSVALASLSSALVIHRNLDRTALPRRVHNVLVAIVEQTNEAWKKAADVPALSRAAGIPIPGMSAPGTGKRVVQPNGSQLSNSNNSQLYEPTTQAQSSAFTAQMWTRLSLAADTTFACFQRVLALERVLALRRDTETQVALLVELVNSPGWGWTTKWGESAALQQEKAGATATPTAFFWHHAAMATAAALRTAGSQSTHLQATFQRSYPRLLRMVTELSEKVAIATTSEVDGAKDGAGNMKRTETAPEGSGFKSFIGILQPYETAYLSRCQSRLFEPVQYAFPNASRAQMPTAVDAEKCVRAVHSELEVARFHHEFFEKVVSVVAGMVGEVAKRGEAMISHEPFAVFTQTGPVGPGAPTGVAINTIPLFNNLDLVVALWTFEEGCWKLVDEFEPPRTPDSLVGKAENHQAEPTGSLFLKIHEHLDDVRSVIMSVVEPLLRGLGRELELVILKMHTVDFGRGVSHVGQVPPTTATSEHMSSRPNELSPYLPELSTKLRWMTTNVFARLSPNILQSENDEPRSWIRSLAVRLLQIFLRNATMIRLGDAGKLRLANDLAQFEFVVNTWITDCGVKGGLDEGKDAELTAQYRALRSLKSLLFLELNDIPTASGISPPLIIQHIYSRSPAGTLLLPTERFSWTPQQYSDWVDAHPSLTEHLSLLRRSLDLYADDVRLKGQREFCVEFPVARALFEKHDKS